MSKRCFYEVLGIARSCSAEDVKAAYRKLAKQLHPDRNKDNPKAAERFSVVTSAYDLLSDKDKVQPTLADSPTHFTYVKP